MQSEVLALTLRMSNRLLVDRRKKDVGGTDRTSLHRVEDTRASHPLSLSAPHEGPAPRQRIRDIRKSWTSARKATGPSLGCYIMIYDLRRIAARNLIRSGIPEVVRVKITGHRMRGCPIATTLSPLLIYKTPRRCVTGTPGTMLLPA
jgi:hypothetical protein